MTYTVTFRGLTLGRGTSYPNISLPQGMDVANRQDLIASPFGGAYANGPDVGEVLRLVFQHWINGASAAATEALRDALAGSWGVNTSGAVEELTVVLASSTGRVYRGRPAGVTFAYDRLGRQGIMEARCEFAVLDPVWYSSTPNTAPVSMPTTGDGITVASGGITVPSGGITVAGGNVAGDTAVLNAGTADVDWSVQMMGPITNPRVSVAGGLINMVGTLAAGSVAVLDSRSRTVSADGVYQTWIQPGSQWRKLPAGTSATFSLRGDSGTGTATITWRDGNR